MTDFKFTNNLMPYLIKVDESTRRKMAYIPFNPKWLNEKKPLIKEQKSKL